MSILKRTFAAKHYPKGSQNRNMLNTDPLTSEYMPSYRYMVIVDNGTRERTHVFRTKAEAQAWEANDAA